MNEDERGITPADATAMTVERRDDGWHVTIEQGNGDVLKLFTLTDMERIQLAIMLDGAPGEIFPEHCSFLDPTRPWIAEEPDEPAVSAAPPAAAVQAGGVDVTARLDEIGSLKSGWLDGEGKPVTAAAIYGARLVIPSMASASWGRPRIYPTPEGGVQAEWTFGTTETWVTFAPSGRMSTGSQDARAVAPGSQL